MAYNKENVKNQLLATKSNLEESLEYYKDFFSYLQTQFPQPSIDVPRGSEAYQKEVLRWSGLLNHTKTAMETAESQLLDIGFHIRIIEKWS